MKKKDVPHSVLLYTSEVSENTDYEKFCWIVYEIFVAFLTIVRFK